MISTLSILMMLQQIILAASSCSLFAYCDQSGTCQNFGSFAQLSALNLSQCDADSSDRYFRNSPAPAPLDHDEREITIIGEPSNPLLFDNSLKLIDLLNVVAGSIKYIFIHFKNLRGIDFNFPASSLSSMKEFINGVELRQTSFEFFYNGASLDMSCYNMNELNMSTNILLTFPFLWIFNSKFPSVLCPLLFHNISYKTLLVSGAQMQFDTKNYSFLSRINCTIKELLIQRKYKHEITNGTVHPSLFKNLEIFWIEKSSVHIIEREVFKGFDRLRLIEIEIINLRFFFHFNTIEWLNHVNNKPDNVKYFQKDIKPDTIDYLKSTICIVSFASYIVSSDKSSMYSTEFFPYLEYTYPDEDYCLFASFPHQNLIVPTLCSIPKFSNLTCTLKWLKQYMSYYIKLGVYEDKDFCDTDLEKRFLNTSCNFTLLTEMCSPQTVTSYSNEYFNMYDLKNTLREIQKILVDAIGPVTSILAILSNILVIITIEKAPKQKKNKNKTTCDGSLYKYMIIGAVVNLIYSSIYLFFYTIKCNSKEDEFKEQVPDTCLTLQTYVNTIASVLKLVSNFALLQLCLNRFVLVGKDHNERVVKIANTKPSRFLLTSLVVSGLLSLIIYFEQQIFGSHSFKKGYVVFEDYYYPDYFWNQYFLSFFEDRKQEQKNIVTDKLNRLPILSAFILIHDFFSYFFYCLISTLIDAFTVKNLKKVLEEKKKTSSINRDKESSKVELKSINMIILSSLSNFLLRFPELFSIIFLYTLMTNQKSHYIFKSLCFSYRECLPIVEMTNVFYLVALCLNFIFYALFDNNFKESLLFWTKNLKKILRESMKCYLDSYS